MAWLRRKGNQRSAFARGHPLPYVTHPRFPPPPSRCRRCPQLAPQPSPQRPLPVLRRLAPAAARLAVAVGPEVLLRAASHRRRCPPCPCCRFTSRHLLHTCPRPCCHTPPLLHHLASCRCTHRCFARRHPSCFHAIRSSSSLHLRRPLPSRPLPWREKPLMWKPWRFQPLVSVACLLSAFVRAGTRKQTA